MTEHNISLNDETDETGASDEQTDLDRLAEHCDNQIEWLSYKITEGRIRDTEQFKVRLKACRTLSTLVRTRMNVEEKRQLDELGAEIMELERSIEREQAEEGRR